METDYRFSFERLNVWQDARTLVKEIYSLTKKFPSEERYGLVDQLKRAAVSISSNLAEGTCRNSYKEKIRFIEISYGSLMEVYSQLILSVDLGYTNSDNLKTINELIIKISKELNALRLSFSRTSH